MFYEQFIKLCTQRGVAPSAAAEAIGVTRKAATGWKNGAEPRLSVKKKLADFFEVPISFFAGADEQIPLREKYGITEGADIDEIVEAMHKNPQLGVLFSRSVKMDDKAVEAVLKIIDVMNREGEDGV